MNHGVSNVHKRIKGVAMYLHGCEVKACTWFTHWGWGKGRKKEILCME